MTCLGRTLIFACYCLRYGDTLLASKGEHLKCIAYGSENVKYIYMTD